jgi:hypothetical protein
MNEKTKGREANPSPEYCPCYSYMDGGTDPECPMHGRRGISTTLSKITKAKPGAGATPAPKIEYGTDN